MSTETNTPTRPPFGEVYDNLTWHDEQAIEKAFDVDIHDLMQQFSEGALGVKGLVLIVRSFELIAEQRGGKSSNAALATVRSLTNAQVTELLQAYLDHEEEIDPEQPVTPAGEELDSVS